MDMDRFKLVPLLEMDEARLVALYVDKLAGLTKKQRAVFDLLSNGMLVKDIAKHLGVAVITVSVAKATIMKKLNANSLQELTAIKRCSSCNYIKPHL
jgi:DNA-binding NarL/FixJ family response regulator